MIIVAGTVRIPPGAIEKARPHMEKMLAGSRAEDGCIVYSYAIDVLDDTLVRVFEIWRDLDALKAHGATPHMAEWRAAFPEMGITDRDISRYTVTDSAKL